MKVASCVFSMLLLGCGTATPAKPAPTLVVFGTDVIGPGTCPTDEELVGTLVVMPQGLGLGIQDDQGRLTGLEWHMGTTVHQLPNGEYEVLGPSGTATTGHRYKITGGPFPAGDFWVCTPVEPL